MSPNPKPTMAMMPLELFFQFKPELQQLLVVGIDPSAARLRCRLQAEVFEKPAAAAISPTHAPRYGPARKPCQCQRVASTANRLVIQDDEDEFFDLDQAIEHRTVGQAS